MTEQRSGSGLRVVMTTDAVGGVWQYSADLAGALAAEGVEILLANLGPPPPLDQLARVRSIPGLSFVDARAPLDWLADSAEEVCEAGRKIAGLAEQFNADVVQLNAPALAAGVEFGRPVIAVNHSCLATWWGAVQGGAPDGDFAWRSELTTRGLAAADRVVTPTAAFAAMTRDAHDLRSLPTAVHNGRNPLPVTGPLCKARDFAFTAGRLWDKGKNAATLDKVAAAISIPLYAAGPTRGPNGDSVAFEHAQAIGILDEHELGGWLARRPVFVSAAWFEPFGLAVLEAAAAGCPLVLSDIPTFRELWDGAALFAAASDAEAFAGAVEQLVADPDLRERMGAAARKRASRYTPKAMAKQMIAIYRELATEPVQRGAAAPVAEAVA